MNKKTTQPVPLTVPVYDEKGKEVRTITLPESLFAAPMRESLVHQVVVSMEANARSVVAHTKGRGEVRGGGKKPWKQKGTGRARHGSTRSPIWVGGGVAHGPKKERDFSHIITKSMSRAALASVLSQKLKDGEIAFVDMKAPVKPQTQSARATLAALSGVSGFEALKTKKKNAALVAFGEKNVTMEKSFRNISNISIGEIRSVNPVSLLNHRLLVIMNPEVAVQELTKRAK